MRLNDEFVIPVAPDRAYALLLRLENVATCVPGGQIEPPDADGVYAGRVVVKLGPMKFTYDGTLRIAEQDVATRTAVIEGAGKASGGSDSARVRSLMEVVPDGDGSRVRMTTDLDIKGRAAQMGASIIGSVSKRMVKQAAECLATQLTTIDQRSNHQEETDATS
jgi:carbon monoxide dehydrogenase subunit G